MGYTKIAGTPVITGLYTILIPTALFAVFGSSRHLVVGADSATAAILSAGLVGLAASGSDEYVALAAVLAFMAAAFLFLARVVRLGFMADFLSRTVLVGFLTGVGLQVALGQLSGMLGLPGGGHGTLQEIWNDLQQIEQVNGWALSIAIVVLMVIVGAKKISPKIPGALIAVVGTLVASWALDLESRVHVLGAVPSGLPSIGLPQVDVSLDLIEKLVPTAFAMFVVILAQSAATSRAYAAKYNEQFSENTDLIGLAMANLGAGLSGTFVVNGSPTKTQMVDSAGGRSQLSLIFTALIVLVVLLFLTKPLAYMPECVLSAVVFLIGVELVDLKGMRKIFVQRRSEFWVALITTTDSLTGWRRTGHPARHRAVADRSYTTWLSTKKRRTATDGVGCLATATVVDSGSSAAGIDCVPFHAQPVLREFSAADRRHLGARRCRGSSLAQVVYRSFGDRRYRLHGGRDAAVISRGASQQEHRPGDVSLARGTWVQRAARTRGSLCRHHLLRDVKRDDTRLSTPDGRGRDVRPGSDSSVFFKSSEGNVGVAFGLR